MFVNHLHLMSGLAEMTAKELSDNRIDKNTQHSLAALQCLWLKVLQGTVEQPSSRE